MMQPYFELLNNFFDHIYVITLHRAADRHVHIRNELQGLNFTFFYGKDKKEFSVDALKKDGIYDEEKAKKHHRYGKPMPAGMIGCSWSHKLVYEDVLKNKYQKVLVLEDDVVLDLKTITHLPQVLKELPTDWELFYFGFAENEQAPKNSLLKKGFYHLLRSLRAFKYSHKTIKNLYPKKVSEHIYRAGYHDCTHAYALTYSGAQKLERLQKPISYVADNLLAHAATNEIVKSYIAWPRIIHQQYQISEQPTYSYLNH